MQMCEEPQNFENLLLEIYKIENKMLTQKIEKRDAVYAVICDNVKRIFYEDGGYKEVIFSHSHRS